MPTFDAILEWATNLSEMKPLEPTLYGTEDCERFLQGWTIACRFASRVLNALGLKAESFVEVSQYSLMEVVWREDVSLDLSQEAIRLSPNILEYLCGQQGPSAITRSFWMVIVRGWRANYQSYSGHRLLPTVKSTLLAQIRMAGESGCLRDSAWEGVKLIDEEIANRARAIDEKSG